MNDVEHDMPQPVQTDFPPLLDWDEVMRDECEDRLGFARRTTYALLTLSSAELVEGFGGSNPPGLEATRRTVALFQAHLRRQAWLAKAAERRLGHIAAALAAAG
ncbi:hypothetical protein [Stenotrophomonas maltophilia]|uniref:hypothetical protein n=1 Tax=Stenotrophomonas maltophilia TaxID=40324 RepID=UPI00066CC105|nr:hypothetical protein [Stenotrophomonas maltophilia]MBH1677469.1 hypothetical protein [Stenotrophomonas maltophilia]MDZ5779181.1 hypothetical protein [Stenotrophomonas maltophilia]PZS44477.1 hypothetical protein A7X60_00665 [Stenotrophomonas maltophilia]HDS1625209.1 hypothetical protein [Stenotrophomonas maltophilia]HEL3198896.1 hypothetical protein [Stenotrophomonas maltophilia]